MIDIDPEESDTLVIVHEAGATRVVISMAHTDGVALLGKLQSLYGRLTVGPADEPEAPGRGLLERARLWLTGGKHHAR